MMAPYIQHLPPRKPTGNLSHKAPRHVGSDYKLSQPIKLAPGSRTPPHTCRPSKKFDRDQNEFSPLCDPKLRPFENIQGPLLEFHHTSFPRSGAEFRNITIMSTQRVHIADIITAANLDLEAEKDSVVLALQRIDSTRAAKFCETYNIKSTLPARPQTAAELALIDDPNSAVLAAVIKSLGNRTPATRSKEVEPHQAFDIDSVDAQRQFLAAAGKFRASKSLSNTPETAAPSVVVQLNNRPDINECPSPQSVAKPSLPFNMDSPDAAKQFMAAANRFKQSCGTSTTSKSQTSLAAVSSNNKVATKDSSDTSANEPKPSNPFELDSPDASRVFMEAAKAAMKPNLKPVQNKISASFHKQSSSTDTNSSSEHASQQSQPSSPVSSNPTSDYEAPASKSNAPGKQTSDATSGSYIRVHEHATAAKQTIPDVIHTIVRGKRARASRNEIKELLKALRPWIRAMRVVNFNSQLGSKVAVYLNNQPRNAGPRFGGAYELPPILRMVSFTKGPELITSIPGVEKYHEDCFLLPIETRDFAIHLWATILFSDISSFKVPEFPNWIAGKDYPVNHMMKKDQQYRQAVKNVEDRLRREQIAAIPAKKAAHDKKVVNACHEHVPRMIDYIDHMANIEEIGTKQRPTGFHDLPDELIEHVFSFLPQPSERRKYEIREFMIPHPEAVGKDEQTVRWMGSISGPGLAAYRHLKTKPWQYKAGPSQVRRQDFVHQKPHEADQEWVRVPQLDIESLERRNMVMTAKNEQAERNKLLLEAIDRGMCDIDPDLQDVTEYDLNQLIAMAGNKVYNANSPKYYCNVLMNTRLVCKSFERVATKMYYGKITISISDTEIATKFLNSLRPYTRLNITSIALYHEQECDIENFTDKQTEDTAKWDAVCDRISTVLPNVTKLSYWADVQNKQDFDRHGRMIDPLEASKYENHNPTGLNPFDVDDAVWYNKGLKHFTRCKKLNEVTLTVQPSNKYRRVRKEFCVNRSHVTALSRLVKVPRLANEHLPAGWVLRYSHDRPDRIHHVTAKKGDTDPDREEMHAKIKRREYHTIGFCCPFISDVAEADHC